MSTAYKYEPRLLRNYIYPSEEVKDLVECYVNSDYTKPLILYGTYGTGKSLLSRLLCRAIQTTYLKDPKRRETIFVIEEEEEEKVEQLEVIKPNVSTSISELQKLFNKEKLFSGWLTHCCGQKYVYCIFEEINTAFSVPVEGFLRLLMDEHQKHKLLLIFHTNNINLFSGGLLSRSKQLEVPPLKPETFLPRALWILKQEGLNIKETVLLDLLKATYDQYADNRKYYDVLDELLRKSAKSLRLAA